VRTQTVSSAVDWRTIAALNAVSAIAQVGQYGMVFVMLPLWLVEQHGNSVQVGMFGAALWLGLLGGVAIAPRLNRSCGERPVVLTGLLTTVGALLMLWHLGSSVLYPVGLLSGAGLGLRWIGLEPWLYRIAPAQAHGRLVGFHEMLVGLAPVVAPLTGTVAGVTDVPLRLGILFSAAASVPLLLARRERSARGSMASRSRVATERSIDSHYALGRAIALAGGAIDAAFASLFPLFAHARGLDTRWIAVLLSVFGLGGLFCQYVLGWLADRYGLERVTVSCAGVTALLTLLLTLPLDSIPINLTMFVLGGSITGFLTLATIAATSPRAGARDGELGAVAMLFTIGGVVGPPVAGEMMELFGNPALVWQTVGLAAGLCAYALVPRSRSQRTH